MSNIIGEVLSGHCLSLHSGQWRGRSASRALKSFKTLKRNDRSTVQSFDTRVALLRMSANASHRRPLGLSSSERCDLKTSRASDCCAVQASKKQHRDFHQTERKLTTPRFGDIARAEKKVVY